MATIVAAAGGGNWTTGATWVGGNAPTTADDAQIPVTAGNITIDAGAVCRSADFSTYTGTVTHSTGVTLTIGDNTAGLGNVALKLVSGMTYTLGTAATSAISFVSTSATQQTIDWGGKTTGSVTFNGVGGSWQYSSNHTANGTSVVVTLTAGTLDINGKSCTYTGFNSSNSNIRTLTLGAATISFTANWAMTTTTNLTFNVNTSTITCSTGNSNFQSGSLTYNNVTLAPTTGSCSTTGAFTAANLTVNGTASGRLQLGADVTVTTLFTVASTSSTNMSLIRSTQIGTSRTITAAAVSLTNHNFMDIIAAGASAPWTATSNIGDAGGNTNITFSTPVTRHWVAFSGGSWAATTSWSTSSGGASGASIPLCHDTAMFNSNSITSGSRTVTVNQQVLPSLDFSALLNTPTIAITIGSGQFYLKGSLKYVTGLIPSGTTTIITIDRTASTIDVAGLTITNALQISSYNSTISLVANFTSSNTFTIDAGTFDSSTFNLSCTTYSSGTANSNTRVLNMGSGTWSATSTGTVWSFATTTSLILNSQTSTIAITDTSSTSKTFAGGNLTYYNLSITGVGTGAVIFTGSNTFNNFTVNPPKTVTFTIATTQTINGTPSFTGTAGNVITINSSSSGTSATLSKSGSSVSGDYLSIKDSTATGGAVWYAGANSTNVSGNTGWIFSALPPTVLAKGGGGIATIANLAALRIG